MRTIEMVSRDEIKNADFISAVDPDSEKGTTIWGDDVLGPFSSPLAPPHKSKLVEIACFEDDPETRAKIIATVRDVRGRVSSLLPQPARLIDCHAKESEVCGVSTSSTASPNRN